MSSRLEEFHNYFQNINPEIINFLIEMVKLETPSEQIDLIEKFAVFLKKSIEPYATDVKLLPGDHGYSLLVEKGFGERKILVLGHLDTVWPVAAENKPPLVQKGNILRGPGVFDMKAGLAMMLAVFRCYDQFAIKPDRKIQFLITPDEETGSPGTRKIIEDLGRKSDLVLVLEPPLSDGSMKIRRKGVGEFNITAIGKEAHSGVNPEDGINAVHEMALQIQEIIKLNAPEMGTTVNVNVIGGGTARNVIPGKVEAEVDFRVETKAEAIKIESCFKKLAPIIPGAKLVVTGGLERPPLEDSPESNLMADLYRELGLELGLDIERKKTGGGSDGNFTAALGIPTLDGLGLDGSGAHTPDEHVLTDRIPVRCALLAELILRV